MGEIELGVMFQVWLPIKWMKEFGGPSRKMDSSIFISFTPIPPKRISIMGFRSISIVGCKSSQNAILHLKHRNSNNI